MKAIVQDAQQNLSWGDVPTPLPKAGEVAISVKATAVNRADLMQRKGLYPPPLGASEIMGLECAGTISAVGPGVTGWQVGESVCALLTGGGYAETVVCPAGHVLPLPSGYSFAQGAAIVEVYATAWLNIFLEGAAKLGERVLIHAGASGVGTAAIQLCKALGNPCFVTVGSQPKLDFCLKLGASAGCLRQDNHFEERVRDWSQGAGVDVILDCVGADYLDANLRSLNTDGRLVLIGIMGGRTASIDLGRMLIKRLKVWGSTLRSRDNQSKTALIRSLREQVWPRFEKGELRSIIHAEYPIQEVERAFADIASNANIGKIVLTV
ncbi:Zinc-containing alcohol dehydrogenase [gamma proteobacterium HdN1]|nr:Zinc-containing alcohol dehydrogenase [gamma proteobacterium HdN1]